MPHRILINEIKKGKYFPVYLLMGEEPYFIDKVADYLQHHFFEDDGMRDFNQQVVYGKDVRANDVVTMAKEYPMMSEHRLLIVREAQDMQKTSGQKESDSFTLLTDYAMHPQMQTLLVLCYKYKKVDKRSAFYKAVSKMGRVMESPTLYDNNIPKYVQEMAEEKGFRIDSSAADLVAAHIGTDLSRVDKELDKFVNLLQPGDNITAALIEKHIGISREYNGFELSNALLERNLSKVYTIIDFFSKNPKEYPNPKIIPMLYSTFLKLLQYHYLPDKRDLSSIGVIWKMENTFRSAAAYYSLPVCIRIIHQLKEYDLKSKGFDGYNVEDTDLLKELCFRILNRAV